IGPVDTFERRLVGRELQSGGLADGRPWGCRNVPILVAIPIPLPLRQAEVIDHPHRAELAENAAVIERAPEHLTAAPRLARFAIVRREIAPTGLVSAGPVGA